MWEKSTAEQWISRAGGQVDKAIYSTKLIQRLLQHLMFATHSSCQDICRSKYYMNKCSSINIFSKHLNKQQDCGSRNYYALLIHMHYFPSDLAFLYIVVRSTRQVGVNGGWRHLAGDNESEFQYHSAMTNYWTHICGNWGNNPFHRCVNSNSDSNESSYSFIIAIVVFRQIIITQWQHSRIKINIICIDLFPGILSKCLIWPQFV